MDRVVTAIRWALCWFVLFLLCLPPVGALLAFASHVGNVAHAGNGGLAAAVALVLTVASSRRYSPWWPGKYALRAWGATFVLVFVLYLPLRWVDVDFAISNLLLVAVGYGWAYRSANRVAGDSTVAVGESGGS